MTVEERISLLRESNRALGRLLGMPEGREILRRNGYDSSRRIKPIIESQPLDDLIDDIRQNGPAVFAVYFPEKHGIYQIELLEFGELVEPSSEDLEAEDSLYLGRNSDGHFSTVGMLFASLAGQVARNRASFEESWNLPLERPKAYSLV